MQKIGFNEPYGLQQAVFDGTKPMTRRMERKLACAIAEYEAKWNRPFTIVSQYYDTGYNCLVVRAPMEALRIKTQYKLYEIVAVAQSYKDCGYESDAKYGWCYDENGKQKDVLFKDVEGWNNKMFVKAHLMPHQIKITDIRIERLQDISEEDCLREGIINGKAISMYTFVGAGLQYGSPRLAFSHLIDKHGVGGKGTWERNPWVVVYTFKFVK